MLNNMKIYSETSLRNFRAWAGAVDNFNRLTVEQLDQLETILEDIYPDGIEETTVNDLFWFDFFNIAEWLGLRVDSIEQEVYTDDEDAERVACAWFESLPVEQQRAELVADDDEDPAEMWEALDLSEKWEIYTAR